MRRPDVVGWQGSVLAIIVPCATQKSLTARGFRSVGRRSRNNLIAQAIDCSGAGSKELGMF